MVQSLLLDGIRGMCRGHRFTHPCSAQGIAQRSNLMKFKVNILTDSFLAPRAVEDSPESEASEDGN